MSKTKKYNKRQKNKTKKNRMMKGGTITHDVKSNIFVAKNQSVSNKEQARFFNVVLPTYLGIAPNNAEALIKYLQERGLTNLRKNKITSNGHRVANITTPENLNKLISVIRVRNDALLTNEGSASSQKLNPVIKSLEIQNQERAYGTGDEGHARYHDIIARLEQDVKALRGMEEGAGKSGEQTIEDDVFDQLSAFALPSSSAVESKSCSSIVVSLPNNDVIGMVIGKKGKNIKQIQKDTKTIIIKENNGGFVDFTITCKDKSGKGIEKAAEILRGYSNITLSKIPITSLKYVKSKIAQVEKNINVNISITNSKIRIIGHPGNIEVAADILRQHSNQAQILQKRPQQNIISVRAIAKSSKPSSKSNKKVSSFDVDRNFHDALVAEIKRVKESGATLTVGAVGGSSKITITIEGNKKAKKRALVYLENTLGVTLRGGGKTRKKRKNKSRKKKRRNKKRRTRRRR